MSSAQSFIVADPLAGWPEPDLSILDGGRKKAPPFLDSYLPEFCARFVREAAEAANAPPDFVAMPLLATAAALIGNSRCVSPWPGWVGTSVLWVATVGLPGSGKTPAGKPVFDVLAGIERERFPAYDERLATYQRDSEAYEASRATWKKDVEAAVKNNTPPPLLNIAEPERPSEPCLQANDATLEKLCLLLREEPKGLLYRRDELAGWVEGMDRYGGGGDRPFWLEAWSGGTYIQHRVKHDRPIRIERLAVSIFGTTQPDKIARMLKRDADDGLLERFLWSRPDRLPYRRPNVIGDHSPVRAALKRLADLQMDTSENGGLAPRIIPFSPEAAEAMDDFAGKADSAIESYAGVMPGIFAKARGQMAQLALVLTYLEWAGEGGSEPSRVEIHKAVMAANLMADYFLPMAERVMQDATLPQDQKDAAMIARWIKRSELKHVNPRSMERGENRYSGPRDRHQIDKAIFALVDRAVLAEPLKSGDFKRQKLDYPVNPKLFGR